MLEEQRMRIELNMTKVEKFKRRLRNLLYENDYMKSLFPSIKEQKPGNDLYPLIATT